MEIINSLLYKEILEQPAIINKICDSAGKTIFPIAKSLLGKFNSIIIAARGSSDNAARYAQYLFGIQNRLHVSLATPSLFSLYKAFPISPQTLVIGISQSGQSPDICSVLDKYRSKGLPTLALTNDLESPLADISEFVIPLQSDPELSVAATKSYTSSLFNLILFSLGLKGITKLPHFINSLPEQMEKQINQFNTSMISLPTFSSESTGFVLGRGVNLSTAFEISLKIKELSGIRAEPYSSADFRHGPISLVRKDDIVIVIGMKGPTSFDLIELEKVINQKAVIPLYIGNIPSMLKNIPYSFLVDLQLLEWISPIITIIPGQLLALKMANDLGLDVDHPFDLLKITKTL